MLAGRAIEVLDLSKDEPQHPYAKLLLILGVHRCQKKLSKVGCPFHKNCPIVLQSICTQTTPTLVEISENHQIACHALCTPQSNDEQGATP